MTADDATSGYLVIDGADGEGGGQILRTSLSCALLTGRAFELRDIRARRPNPGLRAQHLECVLASAAVSGAKLDGATLHSRFLRFTPGQVRPGDHEFIIQTAGSTSLLLQTLALPLAFAGGSSSVLAGGGTHQRMAPSFHYLERVFIPACRRLGLDARITMLRPGFFPRGGGRVLLQVEPLDEPLRAVQLTSRGDALECRVLTCMSHLPDHVASRTADAAREVIGSLGRKRIGKVKHEEIDTGTPAMDPGGAVVACVRWEHGFGAFQSLAERKVRAEDVGKSAGDALVRFVADGKGDERPTVDEYLADQLLLPCALASGVSEYRVQVVSSHLQTNADVLRRFLPACRIEVDGELHDRNVMVRVTGAGVRPLL
ncbi:MAG: RNA 3'-terminal phosphate cyclase [Planctomycetota bacterium]